MKMPRKFGKQPLTRDRTEFPNLNRPIAWAASYTYKMARMSVTGQMDGRISGKMAMAVAEKMTVETEASREGRGPKPKGR